MGKKSEQQKIYPPEIKLEVIRLHLEQGITYEFKDSPHFVGE